MYKYLCNIADHPRPTFTNPAFGKREALIGERQTEAECCQVLFLF